MARYATRTCHCCGIKRPQPQMYQENMYVEVGRSKASVSASTFVGTALGNKKSERAVNSWLFNTNQRNYHRKRTVWVCPDCKAESDRTSNVMENVKLVLGLIFVFILIGFFGVGVK